jgi:hypothetical protein
MEEICDGLSDMYSIEVLPAGPRPHATKHRNARTAHDTPTRAHTIAPTGTRNHTPPARAQARTCASPPTHPPAHARACVRLQMQRDHFHGAQV